MGWGMTMRRRNWLAVGCVLVLLLLPSTAQAEEGPPLSATPASVALGPEGFGKLTLLNETAVELSLKLSLSSEGGEEDRTGFIGPGTEIKIGPGERAPIKVTSYLEPDAFLDVVAEPAPTLPRGAVLRVPLLDGAPVKPAVSEWVFVDTFEGSESGTQLPLTGPCGNLHLTAPDHLADPTKLGTVQANGEQVTVTGTCSDLKSESLDLTTSAGGSSGHTYKGKIKVGEGELDLTVRERLSGVLTALLILLGIAVALRVNSWRGWGRSSGDLRREIRVVEEMVTGENKANVDSGFKKAAVELKLPSNVQGWTIAAAVQNELAELGRSLGHFPNEEQLKKTREALAALELELRAWPGVANRLGELQQRNGQLVVLEKYRQGAVDKTLARVGPLDLKAMREVKAAADEAVTLAGDWPAKAIDDAIAMAENLPGGVSPPASFDAVIQRFREATSAAGAKEALAAFWPAEVKLRKVAADAGLEGFVTAAIPEPTAPFEPVETVDPGPSAHELAVKIFAVDAVVLGMLLLVALVAGMQALWVDKSFGGVLGVTAALAWGLGSGVIGQPLTSALSDLGRSWSVARTNSPSQSAG